MRLLKERLLTERTLVDDGPIPRIGLTFWVRAEDLTSTPVATWPDISGNGNHFTQGTGASQPALASNVLNGYPAVQFDGSNDWLGSTIDSAQPVTWAGVVQAITGSGDRTVIGSRNVANTSQPGAIFYLVSGLYTMFAGSNVSSGVAFNSGWLRFATGFNGASSRRDLNGVLATVNPGTRGPSLWTLGAYISTGTTRTAFWDGYIVEMAGWTRLLTDAEMGDVLGYFAAKYRL